MAAKPILNVAELRTSVPWLVNVPWLLVKSMTALGLNMHVAPDDIFIDPWYEKLDVPLIDAVPVPANVRTFEADDGCAIERPLDIVSVGDPENVTVIPVTPKFVDLS